MYMYKQFVPKIFLKTFGLDCSLQNKNNMSICVQMRTSCITCSFDQNRSFWFFLWSHLNQFSALSTSHGYLRNTLIALLSPTDNKRTEVKRMWRSWNWSALIGRWTCVCLYGLLSYFVAKMRLKIYKIILNTIYIYTEESKKLIHLPNIV